MGGSRVPLQPRRVCVLCLDPMDGPKKSLFELGCTHQYHRGCVYNLLKDGKYKFCPLCQTKIPAELQERLMTFVMKRLHKRTTVNPRNKPCDLYLVEYEDFPEEDHWIWEPFYEISMCMIRMFESCMSSEKV